MLDCLLAGLTLTGGPEGRTDATTGPGARACMRVPVCVREREREREAGLTLRAGPMRLLVRGREIDRVCNTVYVYASGLKRLCVYMREREGERETSTGPSRGTAGPGARPTPG